ncbi:MAG: hypothetical protein WBK75_06290, partial [Acutalibacteraceae bacterium]
VVNNASVAIDGSGNVGIGNSTPYTRLHVQGGTISSGGLTDIIVRLQQTTPGTTAGTGTTIGFHGEDEAGSYGYSAGIKGAWEGSGSKGRLSFYTRDGISAVERVRIDGDGAFNLWSNGLSDVGRKNAILRMKTSTQGATNVGPSIDFDGRDNALAERRFANIQGCSKDGTWTGRFRILTSAASSGNLTERIIVDPAQTRIINQEGDVALTLQGQSLSDTALEFGTAAETRGRLVYKSSLVGEGLYVRLPGPDDGETATLTDVNGFHIRQGRANTIARTQGRVASGVGTFTASTTPANLVSITVPANTLGTNHDVLEFEQFVTLDPVNAGNSATVRVYFGSQEVFEFVNSGTTQTYRIHVVIRRTSATTQQIDAWVDGSTDPAVAYRYTAGAQTLTSDVDLVVQGVVTLPMGGAPTVTARGYYLEWK